VYCSYSIQVQISLLLLPLLLLCSLLSQILLHSCNNASFTALKLPATEVLLFPVVLSSSFSRHHFPSCSSKWSQRKICQFPRIPLLPNPFLCAIATPTTPSSIPPPRLLSFYSAAHEFHNLSRVSAQSVSPTWLACWQY
jgi:hypothetical protein